MPSPDEPAGEPEQCRWGRRRLLQASAAAALSAVAGCSTSDSRAPDRTGRTPERTVETTDHGTTTGDGSVDPRLAGPWPTAHATPANTGVVSASGPRGSPTVKWSSSVALETELVPAVSADGSVATQRDGTVVAYDEEGRVRWSRTHESSFVAAPVVGPEGTVVVGSRDGNVTAYDPDGSVRWTDETPEGLFAPHSNDATPFRVVDDRVVLAHPRGTAIAYALDDGSRVWETGVPGRCHRPAPGDGTVVFTSKGSPTASSSESTVFALDAADGAESWRRDVDGTISIGAGVADGTVYTGDIGGRVRAFSLADGSDRWTVQLDSAVTPWISTIPTVFADRVWVGTLDEGVYAVTEDGVQARAAVDSPTTPAVGADLLYVGSSEFGSGGGEASGALVALDADGETRWRAETRGHAEGHVRYRDGEVVVGTGSGVLAAFDGGDGSRSWQAFERPRSLPTPVVGEGALYCGSRRDGVRGYAATEGEGHLWYVAFEAMATGAPAVTADTVFAGSASGEVAGTPPHEHADPPSAPMTKPDRTTTQVHIDAPSPEPRWRTDLDGPVGDFGYGEGEAYVGSGEKVVSLTVEGEVRWRTDVGAPVRAAPAVGEDAVFVGTRDGTLLALGARDGDVRWRESVGARATAPVLVADADPAMVVAGTDDGVVGRRAADGSERLRRDVGRVLSAPAVTDGRVLAATARGVVHALEVGDGTSSWTTTVGGAVHGSPAVADGTLYVGTRNGELVAMSVADGGVDWRFDLDDWVDGSPVVAYGAVFVVTQSGRLAAVVGDPE